MWRLEIETYKQKQERVRVRQERDEANLSDFPIIAPVLIIPEIGESYNEIILTKEDFLFEQKTLFGSCEGTLLSEEKIDEEEGYSLDTLFYYPGMYWHKKTTLFSPEHKALKEEHIYGKLVKCDSPVS